MPTLYTEEEKQDIYNRYAEAQAGLIPMTSDLIKEFNDAQKGVKGYTDSLNNSLRSLKTSILGVGQSLLDGKQGAQVYNNAISKAADAMTTVASQFGIIGKILGAAIQAATWYVQETTKQADLLYNTYQNLNQVGATGVGGMQEVFESMKEMGYGMEQIGDMISLIKENSTALAQFGGSVNTGLMAIRKVSKDVVDNKELATHLEALGITIADVNKGAINYAKLQTSLGRGNKEVGDQLQSGTLEYLTNLKLLSRITGDTAEAQQAKMDEALADEAVAATMSELAERASAGDQGAKNQLEKIEKVIASDLPGAIKKALLSSAGGDVRFAGPAIMSLGSAFGKFTDTSITGNEFLQDASLELKETTKNFRGLASVHGVSDILGEGTYRDMLKNTAAGSFYERLRQASEGSIATDKNTQEMIDLRYTQLQARNSLMTFINDGLGPAISGMKKLAEVTNSVAGIGNGGASMIGTGRSTYDFGGTSSAAPSVNSEIEAMGGSQIVGALSSASPVKTPQAAPVAAPTNNVTVNAQTTEVSMASGGIASGPRSGYQATLHGTEAVVPLPDGKTIPVEMPDTTGAIGEQTQILAQQLVRFDELIGVLRNQVSISNKILQLAR